jgi:putative hydrolase of the HAD superfamily
VNASDSILCVTFDVGGTLIEPWPSVGHVYAEVAARQGLKDLSATVLNERFKAAWRACKDFDYTRTSWEALVEQTFQGLIPQSGRFHFFPELYERFAEPDAWRIFDDVLPVLDSLASSGVRLAVISNWDERLRLLLRRLRLHDWFETLSISCEVGFAKPSSVIFEHAASRLGLSLDSILHVGDSIEMDLQGAKAAGLQALHLARNSSESSDFAIHSLTELPPRIGNLIRPR